MGKVLYFKKKKNKGVVVVNPGYPGERDLKT